MKWVVVAVAAIAAAVAANVALLRYGGDRHDPVGKLRPVASIPVRTPAAPEPTQRTHTHREDD